MTKNRSDLSDYHFNCGAPYIHTLDVSIAWDKDLQQLCRYWALLPLPDRLPFTDGEQRLRLLLSFVVGSLLGDAFLHLLPEAMEHTESKARRMLPFRGLVVRRIP